MIKYIFTFTLIFIAQLGLFSQTKSTKYVPKKAVVVPKKVNQSSKSNSSLKTNTNSSSKSNTTIKPNPKSNSKILIDSSKISTNKVVIDSSKIVKPNAKTTQKPISGPIGSGPSSYSDKSQKSNTNEVSKNSIQTKLKSKNHVIRNWIVSNLDLGIRFGTNFSTVSDFAQLVYSGANIPNEKPFHGFAGGLIIGIKSSKNIKFQPEVLISQQGTQIVEPMNLYKFRISYLKVPLLLKKNFGEKKLSYFVEGGGYFGYAISKKSEREIGGKIFKDKLEFETKYDVFGKKDNRLDYGPVVGAGLNYQLKMGTVSFNARYEHGLSDMLLYRGEQSQLEKNTGRNRVLSASFGFIYPF